MQNGIKFNTFCKRSEKEREIEEFRYKLESQRESMLGCIRKLSHSQ